MQPSRKIQKPVAKANISLCILPFLPCHLKPNPGRRMPSRACKHCSVLVSPGLAPVFSLDQVISPLAYWDLQRCGRSFITPTGARVNWSWKPS